LSLGLAATAPDQIDGFRLEKVGVVSSTSDICLARARLGAPDGLSILAEAQSAGRGSRGRAWSSPVGNLYLSVLQRPARTTASPADVIGGWSLLSGLALLEALEDCGAEEAQLSLKWPNDILSRGAKLAGVLVEGAIGTTVDWLVIGFGANLAVAPELPGRETAAEARHLAPATGSEASGADTRGLAGASASTRHGNPRTVWRWRGAGRLLRRPLTRGQTFVAVRRQSSRRLHRGCASVRAGES
jgi:Biotin/lipoate A/B protein ligase family